MCFLHVDRMHPFPYVFPFLRSIDLSILHSMYLTVLCIDRLINPAFDVLDSLMYRCTWQSHVHHSNACFPFLFLVSPLGWLDLANGWLKLANGVNYWSSCKFHPFSFRLAGFGQLSYFSYNYKYLISLHFFFGGFGCDFVICIFLIVSDTYLLWHWKCRIQRQAIK